MDPCDIRHFINKQHKQFPQGSLILGLPGLQRKQCVSCEYDRHMRCHCVIGQGIAFLRELQAAFADLKEHLGGPSFSIGLYDLLFGQGRVC